MKLIAAIGVLVGLFSSACFAEMVDNPIYQSWAVLKPGSTVTTNTFIQMDGVGAEIPAVIQEDTLVEVTPEHVVVSTTVDNRMTSMKQGPGPATTRKIPAKVEKDYVPMPNDKITNLKQTKETLEVKGQKVEATRYEYEYTTNGLEKDKPMTVKVKSWISKDVPGGLVKSESESELDTSKFSSPMKMASRREIDYNVTAK